MNGLMNKLSDQSKDSIVRAIKTLFDKNSVTVATLVLKDAIFAACAHPTQVMTTLIPTYAAVVAALHNSVGIDVGAVLVEHLAMALVKSLAEATAAAKSPGQSSSQSSAYIGTKLPANALLLLVYLYNLRVIHHTLIVDLMNALADVTPVASASTATATASAQAGLGDFVELKVELLEHLINHCGTSIRSDDPVSLRVVISTLSKRLANAPVESDGNSRLRFMSEALTDLKNNKSRRIQTTNAEVVKKLRKWLGGIKAALGQKQAGDTCMRVTLQDLLNAETKGRWWRTGASWVGKQQADAEKEEQARRDADLARGAAPKQAKTAAEKTEEEKLLQLAAKLRMNTTARRNIFVVMMSSRDVTDAFERLSRLELKGKEDREVARVLAQCCTQERTYNAFYAELAKLLCAQHRQYKITFQFVFWDAFKAMHEAEDEEGEAAALAERKAVNLARLMAALICSFHLPLTVIKPIEIGNMSGNTILFLSTLMLALFKDNVSAQLFCNCSATVLILLACAYLNSPRLLYRSRTRTTRTYWTASLPARISLSCATTSCSFYR
jgi:nucleolar MIF4G domain-containing protein 1